MAAKRVKYVILGGGVTAGLAAAVLWKPGVKLGIISKEKEAPDEHPAPSKAHLLPKWIHEFWGNRLSVTVTAETAGFCGPGRYYKKTGITIIQGAVAVGFYFDANGEVKAVELKDGRVLDAHIVFGVRPKTVLFKAQVQVEKGGIKAIKDSEEDKVYFYSRSFDLAWQFYKARGEGKA